MNLNGDILTYKETTRTFVDNIKVIYCQWLTRKTGRTVTKSGGKINIKQTERRTLLTNIYRIQHTCLPPVQNKDKFSVSLPGPLTAALK